jgi:S-adenosylmethionine decarboxylase
MAYDDTLFQLGMDLTRSSTAQKEDHAELVPLAHDYTEKHDVEHTSARIAGTHLLVDLYGARRLDDPEHIEATLRRCAQAAGAELTHVHLRSVAPGGGVSGVAMLSESHISVHSWPQKGYAALDVFMSGDARPYLAIEVLRQAFEAREVAVREHARGEDVGRTMWTPAAPRPVTLREKGERSLRRVRATKAAA